ncbi:aldo/keto reductase [Rhizomonospora bruguierae]|uniref:aldo/keto reductase n=1 Tax=Rhizomonospora bruguierae TaxID=1581705 RepID=UPI001BCC86FA|nr:aldo/keto reductase [Micromonospora sp. NBRC 107566]
MRNVELGRTGERVSQLALGCMRMGTDTPPDESVRMLDAYVASGGSFLDTADCYAWWSGPTSTGGESEALIGRWLRRRGRRDDLFIATKGSAMVREPDKLFRDTPDGPVANWDLARKRFQGAGAQTLRDALDGSLRRLGTDHVDLYYVHVDDWSTPLEETLEALAGIVRSGKARHIGWSNVRTWRLERIRHLCERNDWPAPVAVQQEHSYLRRRAGLHHVSIVDDEQVEYLAVHDDLTLVAYSPILKGLYDAADPARHQAMWAYAGPDADARIAAARAVADRVGATGNQVVLSWLMNATDPTRVALMGPRTFAQYESAMGALDVKLTPEQIAALDAAEG